MENTSLGKRLLSTRGGTLAIGLAATALAGALLLVYLNRYRNNLRGEVDSAALYAMLAKAESSPELAEVYQRLASVEERHADVWRAKLREVGLEPPQSAPGRLQAARPSDQVAAEMPGHD